MADAIRQRKGRHAELSVFSTIKTSGFKGVQIVIDFLPKKDFSQSLFEFDPHHPVLRQVYRRSTESALWHNPT